jgi:hypothetical protein
MAIGINLPSWFLQFSVDLASWAGKYLKLILMIFTFILWITNLVDLAITAVFSQIINYISSLDVSAFTNVSLSSIEFVGYVNAIIPVSEFVVLMGLYFSAWLLVILIRWIKSFVPTIAN